MGTERKGGGRELPVVGRALLPFNRAVETRLEGWEVPRGYEFWGLNRWARRQTGWKKGRLAETV